MPIKTSCKIVIMHIHQTFESSRPYHNVWLSENYYSPVSVWDMSAAFCSSSGILQRSAAAAAGVVFPRRHYWQFFIPFVSELSYGIDNVFQTLPRLMSPLPFSVVLF